MDASTLSDTRLAKLRPLFTRNAELLAEPQYLSNQLEAFQDFSLWFEQPQLPKLYRDMLSEMNATAQQGRIGGRSYVGHYASTPKGSVVKKSDDQLPGLYRNHPQDVPRKSRQAVDYIERPDVFYDSLAGLVWTKRPMRPQNLKRGTPGRLQLMELPSRNGP